VAGHIAVKMIATIIGRRWTQRWWREGLKRQLMKLFNKLSVLSLIVLMFSFMNIANAAPACQAPTVSACSSIKEASQCSSSSMVYSDGSGFVCKWMGSFCSNGDLCGTQNACANGLVLVNGHCTREDGGGGGGRGGRS